MNNTQRRSRGSYGDRAPSLSSSQGIISKRSRRKRRGRGRERKRRAGARKRQLKTERIAKNHLRILYWNCGSLSVRRQTAEMLAYSADVACFQETQRSVIKPPDFHAPVCSDIGHGQLIAVRKDIKYKELDVSRWATDNLHLLAVELLEQPIRNVINVYACNRSMKEEDWMVLDDLQMTLPGQTMLCGDFNARGAGWGNTITNPQGVALEDALDKCYLTCINDGSTTRTATRDGDSDSVIDLTLASFGVAQQCVFKALRAHGNDHFPCSVHIRRHKATRQQKRAKAFHYSAGGDDPISKLRAKRSGARPKEQTRNQPPWFNKEVEGLWKVKKAACRRSQRNRDDDELREAAKQASNAFEKAASSEKERIYEEFSLNVSEDRTLHKLWQLHKAMNGATKRSEVPDFRREDGVWVRTPEEKGTALLERYLKQTDQGNEFERRVLMQGLQERFEDELRMPHTNIETSSVKAIIATATDSASGPDGVRYKSMKDLDQQGMQYLTNMLNDSLAKHSIPEEWLDSHLAPVPIPRHSCRRRGDNRSDKE